VEERLVPSGTPTLDLTTRGALGVVNEAIFRQFDARPTGTGVIDSFVRLQTGNAKSTVQQGYNTEARPLQFDENKSPQFTRALRLDDVPVVNIGGKLYREFLLDINQKSSQPLLSLDEVRFYLAPTPDLTGYDNTAKTLGGYQALYDLDAGGQDHWIKLDYRLNSGSGSGDMLMYIPESVCVRTSENPYVYLYSKFGVNFSGNAGFEEWAAGKTALVPATGVISGTKFNDLNRDGIRQIDEPGLKDWIIYIDANGSGERDYDEIYAITNELGQYQFKNLATGMGQFSVYLIREEQQGGWTQILPTPSEPGQSDGFYTVSLTYHGQEVTGIDFGNVLVKLEEESDGPPLPE
jgi:hypothetical protein